MRKYIIPGRLGGLNEYTLKCRTHYQAGAKFKKEQQQIVKNNIVAQDLTQLKTPIFVKFKWIEPNKRRDFDNIAFAKKFFFDSLQELDVIENDNWNYVSGFEDTFDVDKENPRVEVTIYENGEF